MPTPLPNAILASGGIKATGNLLLEPGSGFHVHVGGNGPTGSIWSDTRTTGALSSDYSLYRFSRATINKWSLSNNLDGTGNDDFFVRRDNDGVVTDLNVLKVTRSTGKAWWSNAMDVGGNLTITGTGVFTGTVTANGVLLTGGGSGVPATGGTFTGNVGFGGATPAFPLHVEKSVAADAIAKFRNTSATGLGVSMSVNSNTNYALKIKNANDTMDTLQFFGDGIIQTMPTPTFIPGIVGGVRRDQGLRIYSGKNSDGFGEDATIFMVSNVGGASTQWSSSAHVGYFRQGADGGMRMEMNFYTRADNGNNRGYEQSRYQATWGFDSAGDLSYKKWQYPINGNGTFSGQFCQTLVINGSGKDASTGLEEQFVDIELMEAGREMAFCTSAVINEPKRSFIIRTPPSGSSGGGTVSLYARLALDRPAVDGAPLRWNIATTPSGIGNGDMWYDGSDLKLHTGGVTYTLTKI